MVDTSSNPFKKESLVPENITPVYDHGFSEEQVMWIKQKKEEINKRDLNKFPVTLDEFKTIIVPWQRIHRTEEFILHPVKVKKPRAPKAPKVVKPKKLTKKQIKDKLNDIIFKQATGEQLTTEETTFFDEQMKLADKLL